MQMIDGFSMIRAGGRLARTQRVAFGAVLAPALLALALLALALLVTAAPAHAQERRVMVRSSASPFETEVNQLVQQLLEKRRMAGALASNVQQLQVALRSAAFNDEQRTQAERSVQLLRSKLESLENEDASIRQRLEDMCDADRKPDGWVGIAYSVSANATRQDDGRIVMRFVDYPSIESVEPGSPADKAGIRGGDRILAMAGQDLREAEIDFTPLLKPGARIPFRVQRAGAIRSFTVTVEQRPDGFSTPCPWVDERIAAAFAPSQVMFSFTTDETDSARAQSGGTKVFIQRRASVPTPPSPPSPGAPVGPAAPVAPMPPLPPVGVGGSASAIVFGGAQFIAVSPELSEALGVERGLLVTGMGRGSPAEQSGLRTGDVLVAVDGKALVSPLVFLQAVERSAQRALRLQLVRKRKPTAVTLRW